MEGGREERDIERGREIERKRDREKGRERDNNNLEMEEKQLTSG
jgi:hypothetical protein